MINYFYIKEGDKLVMIKTHYTTKAILKIIADEQGRSLKWISNNYNDVELIDVEVIEPENEDIYRIERKKH